MNRFKASQMHIEFQNVNKKNYSQKEISSPPLIYKQKNKENSPL